ncbi:hypothetical protein VN0420_11720 [Helicobacter pylori]|nr:hypothetical protein VN0420_11720 [Helicobacter pylori]
MMNFKKKDLTCYWIMIFYCSPKDLLKQLEKISASLSKDIVIAIKQVEKLELNYALIDNIQHNTLDDTLDFTFIIGDSLSIQSLYVIFDLVIDIDRPMSEQFLNHIGELGSFKSSRKKNVRVGAINRN